MDIKENNNKDSNIEKLIQALGSKNGIHREKARMALIEKGKEAIRPLLKLLDDPIHIFRWEAMKALKEIGDPSLLPVFLSKLEDDKSDIRWMAAEGLIKLRQLAIAPLLNLLMENTDSVFVLSGAHHIFHELREKKILPVDFPADNLLASLKNTGPTESLKINIYRILNDMRE